MWYPLSPDFRPHTVTIEREMLGKKKPRAEASHSATGGDEGKSKDAEGSGEQSKPGEPPHTK